MKVVRDLIFEILDLFLISVGLSRFDYLALWFYKSWLLGFSPSTQLDVEIDVPTAKQIVRIDTVTVESTMIGSHGLSSTDDGSVTLTCVPSRLEL